MEVVEWTPRINGRAGLFITARLLCPFCRTEAEVETISQLFYGLPTADGGRIGSIDFGIATVVQDLSEQRACEHCGIISVVPKLDYERVLREAHSSLTTNWFSEELQRMREAEAALA
jgi:hypothetical protein